MEVSFSWGVERPDTWDDLLREYRCVILAEAGAGKTVEFLECAKILESAHRFAFFIRIEDIDRDFYDSFEVGDENLFDSWLSSTKEAWFFLDSVDEARLVSPRAFEKAIQRFSKGIQKGSHRAHVYISSRPYSWRPQEDQQLMDEKLFLPLPEKVDEGDDSGKHQSSLKIYTLRHLDRDRVRKFCEAREANDIDALLNEIARTGLWNLAERPFDLEGILSKWLEDSSLGCRLDLLRYNIDKRLSDSHNVNRAQLRKVNLEKARDGAQRLAAAVVLTGKVGINVPDSVPVKPGIDADTILHDWDQTDIKALLDSGIFNDVIYGAVRFRHRDVREVLAAEWFDKLIKSDSKRPAIESLFFREQFGESIVTPLLRPILPWLILFDDEVRRKAINIHPEIAVEDGDPSKLPLNERRKILLDIVHRIASNSDNHSARDNSAIARIANLDLSTDIIELIQEYHLNDDAMFFLGRLVWQGGMANCVEYLIPVALESEREKYARIASIRAVMTCGTDVQKLMIWQTLNEQAAQVSRDILAEIVEEAKTDKQTVDLLLNSISKLTPYKKYNYTGLTSSLYAFVERCEQKLIPKLLEGLQEFLNTEPYVERRECLISEKYTWLVGVALKAIEKLIKGRDSYVITDTPLSILINVPALRFWRGEDFTEQKNELEKLVREWAELNDALYWRCIEQAREFEEEGKPVKDDLTVSYLDHFWNFDSEGFVRLLNYINARSFLDDRLVALSTAFRIYQQSERPVKMLEQLQIAVKKEPVLCNRLNSLLNPIVSDSMKKYEERAAERKRKHQEKEVKEERDRLCWIESLRKSPEQISNPQTVKQGELTNNHVWLLSELERDRSISSRKCYANWRGLTSDFGKQVAKGYKDFSIKHWKNFKPKLRSEEKVDNTVPFSLILALAGLEMEAAEHKEFPLHLNDDLVRLALRYLTWDINGFPTWFELMHQSFPELVEDAVMKELIWELKNSQSGESLHYILHDLVYYAPWLHIYIAPRLLKWMLNSSASISVNKNYCLQILINGDIKPEKLSKLAKKQIEKSNDNVDISWWYALLVDCSPANGIPALELWLSRLEGKDAEYAAQVFITALMGDRQSSRRNVSIGNYRTVRYLKSLYILMHEYIKADVDIDRANDGVFTPELRDNAQEARDSLFGFIVEVPGKESYCAVKQLIEEHPDPKYRPRMEKRAYRLAEISGDITPWSSDQVRDFHKSASISPESHRQLFDLTILRINELKNWVEHGNDSPWKTWQRADEENELRTLIAGWLRQHSLSKYTIAEEPELANSQRMDIWLHSPNVLSPVPIELKLLDKGWSGPDLCERLRNQLVGDYLREESAGCGVFLLISQKTTKKWLIDGHRVGLDELAQALKKYWREVSHDFAGVEAIEVIVIDLNKRKMVSCS